MLNDDLEYGDFDSLWGEDESTIGYSGPYGSMKAEAVSTETTQGNKGPQEKTSLRVTDSDGEKHWLTTWTSWPGPGINPNIMKVWKGIGQSFGWDGEAQKNLRALYGESRPDTHQQMQAFIDHNGGECYVRVTKKEGSDFPDVRILAPWQYEADLKNGTPSSSLKASIPPAKITTTTPGDAPSSNLAAFLNSRA